MKPIICVDGQPVIYDEYKRADMQVVGPPMNVQGIEVATAIPVSRALITTRGGQLLTLEGPHRVTCRESGREVHHFEPTAQAAALDSWKYLRRNR